MGKYKIEEEDKKMSLVQSAKDLIEYIDAFNVPLKPYQKDALRNIRRQVEHGQIIKLDQLRILEEIYKKASGGGIWQQRQHIK